MPIPSFTNNTGLDTSDPVAGVTKGQVTGFGTPAREAPGSVWDKADPRGHGEARAMTERQGAPARADLGNTDLLQTIAEAEAQADAYLASNVRSAWQRSLKAWRNEHFDGSKYTKDDFRTRSKIFRPKTRTAIRKDLANAAEAMFATADVVKITAQDESDPMQVASASLKQELVNYRLSRTSGRNGIPWFLIAMGARLDAALTGWSVSVQSWKFKERVTPQQPFFDNTGTWQDNPEPKRQKLIDRPDINLIPPENVLLDPAADWTNPAQSGRYLIIRHPMHVDDIVGMMKADGPTLIPWLNVEQHEIEACAVQPTDPQAIRRARENGMDRTDRSVTGSRFPIVWAYQVFLRMEGEDYTFWSLGKQRLLSDATPTIEAYPWLGGERPVVIGYGQLDSHRIHPMSAAESWQQLQQEANDTANLRLDGMKAAVTPVAKVRRGRQVDLAQVQRRGPNGVILVNEVEDVEWDRPPDVPQSAFMSEQIINADFDSLAGDFNTGSVETNRRLNETVGGMKLMAGAANTVTGFDLRLWGETWVERVIAQVVKMEEALEDDETVLAIAGERAKLFEKFGIDEITDEFLMAESTVRIDIGTGGSSHDPMQGLEKFTNAMQIVGQALMPFIEAGQLNVKPKPEAIINEVFGKAGFKDGGERFFEIGEPQPPQPDPKAQAEAEALKAKTAATLEQTQAKTEAMREKAAVDQQLGKTKLQEAAMKARIAAEQADMKAGAQRVENHSKVAMAAMEMRLAREKQQLEREKLELERERMKFERQKAQDELAIERERNKVEREKIATGAKAARSQAQATVITADARLKAAKRKAAEPAPKKKPGKK